MLWVVYTDNRDNNTGNDDVGGGMYSEYRNTDNANDDAVGGLS